MTTKYVKFLELRMHSRNWDFSDLRSSVWVSESLWLYVAFLRDHSYFCKLKSNWDFIVKVWQHGPYSFKHIVDWLSVKQILCLLITQFITTPMYTFSPTRKDVWKFNLHLGCKICIQDVMNWTSCDFTSSQCLALIRKVCMISVS
jgi:hypothetical protein